MLDEERITWNKDEDDKKELETTFYEGFEKRRKPVKSTKRGKKSVAKAKKDDVERYQWTLTLIFSSSLSSSSSIGPVSHIDTISPMLGGLRLEKEKVETSTVSPTWFLRPSELASIRAKRDHAKVCMVHTYFHWLVD